MARAGRTPGACTRSRQANEKCAIGVRAKKTGFISGMELRLAPYAALDSGAGEAFEAVEASEDHGAIEASGVDYGAPGSGLSSYCEEHKGDVAAARSVLLEKPGRDDAIAPNAGFGCAD